MRIAPVMKRAASLARKIAGRTTLPAVTSTRISPAGSHIAVDNGTQGRVLAVIAHGHILGDTRPCWPPISLTDECTTPSSRAARPAAAH
jgi:hypothetical protein